jgi:pyruvate,water dikinase
MRSGSIRRLRDVTLADAGAVGGKAASLGALLATGVRVPDGVVLPVDLAGAPPDVRRAAVDEAMAELGAGPFAVRSSGIAEDGAEHSFAGMYETVLDVAITGVADAVDRCLASATADRVAQYAPDDRPPMAVLIQRMVRPTAAGVALTADPVTGDRSTCVVTAVRGLGERLVSGAAIGDEWVVSDGHAFARRQSERAIDRRQAEAVVSQALRIAAARGVPQDVEWAIDADGTVWILQARPMTALPPDVTWDPPAPGAYTRNLRFGEWISEPVTPLFESWLLSTMEERTHAFYLREIGQRIPRPYHVVVNGWYFYTLNWATPAAFARNLPNMLWHLIRSPRKVAGINPSTARHAYPVLERAWRADVQPRYRAAVGDATPRVETVAVAELPALIDELADLAGEAFGWVTALAGAAYKLEITLARFYQRHLAPTLGGTHLPLLTGIEAPSHPSRHAVASLDWWHEPGPQVGPATRPAAEHAALVEARRAAEQAALTALASSPRRLRAFRRLLADAQHLVPLREEQVAEMTISWPVMRRAVMRIGEVLASRGIVAEADDVFFLTRKETLAALADASATRVDVAVRRSAREEQARLVPPLIVGQPSRLVTKLFDGMAGVLGASPSNSAIVSGTPASPGRASGPVRVIRGPEHFNDLQPGEVLVASITAPAWTPLFTRAGAVVTDVGSPAAHASIIAREYGIPAVVGCGDATARLKTGMRVTVDGSTGNVEPELAGSSHELA